MLLHWYKHPSDCIRSICTVKLVYPEGILYNKNIGGVRTPKINSLFASIEPLKCVLKGNKKGNSIKIAQNLIQCSGLTQVRTFLLKM